MSDHQLFLFSDSAQSTYNAPGVPQSPQLEMTPERLQEWKGAIAAFQQDVRFSPVEEQGSLFQVSQPSSNATAVDPFFLHLYNFFFFEQPASNHPAKPAIYFVIDTTVPVILYIGETVKANQRWKGIHDCKRYILNYRDLHYKYNIPTTINTAFYWNAPLQMRPRQQLESALIYRWRSPFNKENWDFWGTPFVGGKLDS